MKDIEKQNAKIPIKQLIVHILLNFENSIDATSISDSITDESVMEYKKFSELAANNSKDLLRQILI